MAAVTNDYKLGSLEQHKHILLEFGRSEVHNQSHTPCRLSSLAFSARLLSSHLQSQQSIPLVSPSATFFLCSQISLPQSTLLLLMELWNCIQGSPTQIVRIIFPSLRVPILSSKVFKPEKVNIPRSMD